MANWYGSARSNYFKVKDIDKYKDFLMKWGGELIEKEFEINMEKCQKCLDKKIDKACEHYVKRVVDKCDGIKVKQQLVGFLGSEDSGSLPNYYEDEVTGVILDHDDFLKELSVLLEDGWVAVMQEVGAEKLRYITGWACAINSKGETEVLDISEIYQRAEKLGKGITRCEY